MPETTATSAFQAVTQLAGQTPVHRAFQWFHLQEPQLRAWHASVAAIPAPPFQETARARWLTDRFRAIGLADVEIDACGNALGWLRASSSTHAPGACTLLSAHLDTVFPAAAIGQPIQDGSRLIIPGASDNCAGLIALLAVAAAMQSAGIRPETDILFCGNVGEEGEGNLRGMRHLFAAAHSIRSAVVLDGAGTESIVTRALGSRRFRIEITGPGGHSWSDAHTPNPILVLAAALHTLTQFELPHSPRTTWNVGHIFGGTAINSIPQQAEARIDTRSTDPELLLSIEETIRRTVEDAVEQANHAARRLTGTSQSALSFQVEMIGERPAAALSEDAAILVLLRAVDRHLSIRSQPRIASTDANIPLALGIEAVSIGSGGTGGGVHTLEEWFDATGRDLALRRILLLVLALTGQQQSP